MSLPQLFTVLFGLLIIMACIFAYCIALSKPATSKLLEEGSENENKSSLRKQEFHAVLIIPLDKSAVLLAIADKLGSFTFRDQMWQFADVSPPLGILRAIMDISESTEYGDFHSDVVIELNVCSRFSSGSKSGNEIIHVDHETSVSWTFENGASSADLPLGNSMLHKELATTTSIYISEFLAKLEADLRDGKQLEVAAGAAPVQLKIDLSSTNQEEGLQALTEITSGCSLKLASLPTQDSLAVCPSEIPDLPTDSSALAHSVVSFKSEEASDRVLLSKASACPDCKRELDPSFDFCLYCGQKAE